jgi:hypothetical protein
MKLHILILSTLLMVGCGGSTSESNANYNRPPRANSATNKDDNSHVDKEREARVRQKVEEFVATNYAGWTLKGTENLGKSPLDLHIVKGAEEKVIKVNYKEFNDLNGQPYIVVTKIAQNDLTEENLENKQTPKTTPSVTEQETEKNAAPNN